MSEVIFEPAAPDNDDGWPAKVLGNGIVRGEFVRTTDVYRHTNRREQQCQR